MHQYEPNPRGIRNRAGSHLVGAAAAAVLGQPLPWYLDPQFLSLAAQYGGEAYSFLAPEAKRRKVQASKGVKRARNYIQGSNYYSKRRRVSNSGYRSQGNRFTSTYSAPNLGLSPSTWLGKAWAFGGTPNNYKKRGVRAGAGDPPVYNPWTNKWERHTAARAADLLEVAQRRARV